MSRYQHTKGQIKDNALEALLHDPLFRQRVEKNKKGKGSYQRKEKHAGQNGRGGQWQESKCFLPLAFCLKGFLRTIVLFFQQVTISLSRTSSLVGAGGAAGASSLSCSVYSSV